MKQMSLPNPQLQRERCRKYKSTLVMCNHYSGIFSQKHFSRHKNICTPEKVAVPTPIPVSLLSASYSKVSMEFRGPCAQQTKK
jgi:hypothetical protein